MGRALERIHQDQQRRDDLLEEALNRLGIEPEFTFNNLTLQETAIDYMREGTNRLRERLNIARAGT